MNLATYTAAYNPHIPRLPIGSSLLVRTPLRSQLRADIDYLCKHWGKRVYGTIADLALSMDVSARGLLRMKKGLRMVDINVARDVAYIANLARATDERRKGMQHE